MPPSSPRRPTKEELLAARGRGLPDVIAPGLKVLFCGINPGLYSGAVGHHFARPGNRFWTALYRAGFTEVVISPYDERLLLSMGYGLTNIVDRATAQAQEVPVEELRKGALILERKVLEFRPRFLAVLGIDAYRKAFNRPKAIAGPQHEKIGETRVWVLPSPSGINASYQIADLVRLLSELRLAVMLSN
jgi:TDG/mug DNA glycosylase family protein